MSKKTFIDYLGQMAIKAILYEVSVTPKPGLVDRNNNGAHRDMDFYTFLDSVSALHGVFDRFTEIGIETRNISALEARRKLQSFGLEAEKKMYKATNGINTHKGIIFSLGFICGAAGRIGEEKISIKAITDEVRNLCFGLCDEAFRDIKSKKELTNGEKVYMEYGIKGVRKEAENGYVCVTGMALPLLREALHSGDDMNTACVKTLLSLMDHTSDTNVLARHNMEVAEAVMEESEQLLKKNIDIKGVEALDKSFIKRNISPGGCADLLAVTLFFHFVC